MCGCMKRINENLKERNTKLSTGFCLSKDLGSADLLLIIQTEKLDKRSRVKPVTVIPTFCPFCAERYQRQDAPPNKQKVDA